MTRKPLAHLTEIARERANRSVPAVARGREVGGVASEPVTWRISGYRTAPTGTPPWPEIEIASIDFNGGELDVERPMIRVMW